MICRLVWCLCMCTEVNVIIYVNRHKYQSELYIYNAQKNPSIYSISNQRRPAKKIDNWRASMSKQTSPRSETALAGHFELLTAVLTSNSSYKDSSCSSFPFCLSSNQFSPRINISLEGKTSKISHSKSGTMSLYLLQSCCCVFLSVDGGIPSSPAVSPGTPRPTATSSNVGSFSNFLNI